ncbi:thiosulfate sulfurtransferase/rhodanese-like domain-containing protein 1 [Colossoma macropomum]|uniref:thiosulfate sulfurtransferase/rhodanese-like domain-containing protein 1 n=1 Tax=Colossoma macropomum TaxID=42526 RepID=UPI001864A684|nr:thiosulfate sulfurtransferase/rhodanese-like domain-containing protein 1 [Colossoma macropomum]
MLSHTAVHLVLLLSLGSWAEGLCPDDLDSSCKQNPYKEPVGSDTVVSYEQLKQMLESGNVQLFDVREPDEFEEGAIAGATNTPLSELEQAFTLPPDQFRELYGVSMPGKDDPHFILYCQRGRRSLTALEIVQGLGYSRARHYAGGYSEWAELEAQ